MSNLFRYSRFGLAAAVIWALAACGGGSGSGTGASPSGNQPPTARIATSTNDGFAPFTVTFDGSGSTDPDGSITSYDWEFGDGGAGAAGARVSHTFEETGIFTVTLQVTDDDGATGSTSTSVRARGATISGVIRIAAGSGVDSDVNDRLTEPVSNNSFGDAQPVASPLRLGGFVNRPGTGPTTGNFRDSGDTEDIFAVDLAGGERIILSVGDPSADLDLELYSDDPTPELIDASVSQSPHDDPTEDLEVPEQAGRYFVRVLAVSGASTYVLSIGEEVTPTGLARRAKRLSDPFVPGEVLAEIQGAALARYGVAPVGGGDGLRLEPKDRPHRAAGEFRISEGAAMDFRLPEVEIAEGAVMSPAMHLRYRTLHAARHLGGARGVELAELNVLRQPMRVPNDPFYDRQWHFRTIGLEQAWDITTGEDTSSPVVVAVVDTGVLLDHPDIENRLLRDSAGRVVGYDFIQDPRRANDGDGLDPDPDDPGDEELGPGQGSFHGTHVAGIVAAESNNGIGVAGISWGARLMPLRALGVGGGTTFDVLQAVRYAAGLSNVSGTTPPVRADIINLSLGSDFYSESEQQALNEVRARGILVVASAGNKASSVPSYPAAYEGVIAVAAINTLENVTFYSNFGTHIHLAAPGGQVNADADGNSHPDGIASTIGTGGGDDIEFAYGLLAGTSMAAPHVAGVMALMKSVLPELTPNDFDALLASGRLTDDAGPEGRDDRYGWGIINAYKSVLAALELRDGGIGPIISLSAYTLNFQSFTQELRFSVTNAGDTAVAVEVMVDVPWLTVSQISGGEDGFGEYLARVDRGGLTEGTHRGMIVVQPLNKGIPTAFVDVVMRVVVPDPSADAGQHYVVLVSPHGEESLAADIVTAHHGEYVFDLTDIPAGDYRIFAGTDLDDDDFICDGGEACGAYPSLANPQVVTVEPGREGELEGLTFASEFRTTATTDSAAGTSGTQAPLSGLKMERPGKND